MTPAEATGLPDGTPVEVLHLGKWQKTVIDAHEHADARYGWELVAGIRGRAGPFAVRVDCVRRVVA